MADGDIAFSLQDSNTDMHHWRIEVSSNLVNWSSLESLRTVDGQGAALCDDTHLQGPRRAFYRAILDNSVSHVVDLPALPLNYRENPLPAHLLAPPELASDNTPAGNPITDHGATLGRVLFYDQKLSQNFTISCASCHQQQNGFSDPAQFSSGFAGGLTGRNSMGLSNARYYGRGHFFWDERADTLEDQVLGPIQNDTEMGMTLTGLVARLDQYDYYGILCSNAFGDSTVTTGRISRALAQFARSMVSYRSKFDVGAANNFANFTAEEQLGRDLFNGPRGNCAACHSGPNFVGNRIENNGLENPFRDLGVGGVTGNAQDEGKFKMSSLRNIEMTAPYMHDGRFATLEAVIDHYSTGVVATATLGPQLRTPPRPGSPPQPRRPNFTPQEKDALVAFLKTLTDPAFLGDSRYSDPFRDVAD